MRDLVFPARKKYARLMLGPCSEAHFEAYTKSELKGHFITRLNGVELDGGAMNHYLIQGKKQNMEELHSSLELPEPVWKHIKSVPVIRRRNSPKIMAVANATPDSFFSGSRVNAEPQALQKIVDSGPDIIDIGGEKKKPGGRGKNNSGGSKK